MALFIVVVSKLIERACSLKEDSNSIKEILISNPKSIL
jgi:hypothetical protein